MIQIPDERDITKQQLWYRIDEGTETIQTVGRNVNDNLQQTLSSLKKENKELFDRLNLVLDRGRELNDVRIDTGKKEMAQLANESYTRLVTTHNEFMKRVDERLQTMKETLDEAMSNKISDSFKQLSDHIDDYVATVNKYKKDNDAQIFSVQKEVGAKLGEIKGLFENMKERFKKVTEQFQ